MDRIADEIRTRVTTVPEIGLILGSGLGALSESIQEPTIIPYHDLSKYNFPQENQSQFS